MLGLHSQWSMWMPYTICREMLVSLLGTISRLPMQISIKCWEDICMGSLEIVPRSDTSIGKASTCSTDCGGQHFQILERFSVILYDKTSRGISQQGKERAVLSKEQNNGNHSTNTGCSIAAHYS